jgi:hypothetical protein
MNILTHCVHVYLVRLVYLKKNTQMTLKEVFEVLSDKIIALCQFNGEFLAKIQ